MIIDTNVVLDVLLARDAFVGNAARIFSLVERAEVEGCLCATTITTVDYLLGQSLSRRDARQALRQLIGIFEIAAVNRSVIEGALRSAIVDFEDAVMAEAGRLAGAEAVVTRNVKDFQKGALKAVDPAEFLAGLKDR